MNEKWPREPLPKDQWLRTSELRFVVDEGGIYWLQQRFTDFDAQVEEWRDVPVARRNLTPELKSRNIRLRLVQPEDADFIVSLRSDPTKNAHLSPSSPDGAAQRTWLVEYKSREAAGSEYYFVIEDIETGASCGVVRIYNINGSTFTWGSWIVADGARKTTAIESALLVYVLAFDHLGMALCEFDVRLGNAKALAFHDRFGAIRTHATDLDQFFIYPKSLWLAQREKFAKFLTPE